jgi:hypothetical protein
MLNDRHDTACGINPIEAFPPNAIASPLTGVAWPSNGT